MTRVECKVGSRSEPDLCTDEGGTRVSAYVARLSNKNAPQTETSFQDMAWDKLHHGRSRIVVLYLSL